jgi:hypothetical protein
VGSEMCIRDRFYGGTLSKTTKQNKTKQNKNKNKTKTKITVKR